MLLKKTIRLLSVSVAGGALALTASAGSAAATPAAAADLVGQSITKTVTMTDAACVAQGLGVAACTVTGTVRLAPARTITATEVARHGGLRAADGMTLAQAAGRRAIHSTPFSQTTKNKLGLWSETQRGTVWWDGTRAWVSSHWARTGTHDCDNGRRIGGTIKILNCSTFRDYSPSVDVIDKFRATGLHGGLPFSSTYTMIFHINGNGTYQYKWL